LKTVNAGAVTIAPCRLHRISADNLKSREFKAAIGITGPAWAGHNIPEHIRLAAAGRTGTGAPEQLEIEIRLGSIVPMNGELIANLLNVGRFESHGV
jgi:hypothetical protein